jgi:hypothetical protein
VAVELVHVQHAAVLASVELECLSCISAYHQWLRSIIYTILGLCLPTPKPSPCLSYTQTDACLRCRPPRGAGRLIENPSCSPVAFVFQVLGEKHRRFALFPLFLCRWRVSSMNILLE